MLHVMQTGTPSDRRLSVTASYPDGSACRVPAEDSLDRIIKFENYVRDHLRRDCNRKGTKKTSAPMTMYGLLSHADSLDQQEPTILTLGDSQLGTLHQFSRCFPRFCHQLSFFSYCYPPVAMPRLVPHSHGASIPTWVTLLS